MNSLLRTIVLSSLLLHAGMALSSSISGTVKDSEGAVIGKARITIHRDPSGGGKESEDVVLASDANGKFSVDVNPGFYDIFVSSSAFSPQCAKVRVKDTEPSIYTPRLHADPLISKELGDRF